MPMRQWLMTVEGGRGCNGTNWVEIGHSCRCDPVDRPWREIDPSLDVWGQYLARGKFDRTRGCRCAAAVCPGLAKGRVKQSPHDGVCGGGVMTTSAAVTQYDWGDDIGTKENSSGRLIHSERFWLAWHPRHERDRCRPHQLPPK